MPELLSDHPGLWFVAATLLPLLSVILLCLAGFLRNALRQTKDGGGFGAALFQMLGGDVTGRGPAYVATAAIGLAFVCSLTGFIFYLSDEHHGHGEVRHIKTDEHKHEHKHAFDKGAAERKLAAAQADAKAAHAATEKAKQNLNQIMGAPGSVAEFDIATAKVAWFRARESELAADANVDLARAELATDPDLEIAKVRLATVETKLHAAQATKDEAERNLNRLKAIAELKIASADLSETLAMTESAIADATKDVASAKNAVSLARAELQKAEQQKHDDHPKTDEKKTKEAKQPSAHKHEPKAHAEEEHHGSRWTGSITWAEVTPKTNTPDRERASTLKIGYYIDSLSAIMFVMVTFIATLIHLFSIGYMSDELQKTVEDHQVHAEHGHFHRRGRFGRFFLFLSLFSFSMLNLILADNLFQVFVSWELVGVCSYLLVGFYYERTSAANAANKAFITNRVGDAGFIIGLLIVWSYVGTLNFQEVFERIRCPELDKSRIEALAAGKGALYQPMQQAWQIVRADGAVAENGNAKLELKKKGEGGDYAVIFPRHAEDAVMQGPGSTIEAKKNPGLDDYSYMPYWMLVVAGLGIFLGCVGKSAQFPLQVWLPDAMEGPTPVSALIHAATMVAAGVYLVGRCYPLFTFEVTLTIAYIGAITLFMAATVAVVMTDIKKVLAYSTVSQLGYMMLALGVGGWAAGLFHLVTHAFFKALLFLGSGSVIYGCHHEQDMRKMGGLYPKMKITALCMLMGVLAISGIPLFSGWYSKDAVIASAFGFMTVHREHTLLFVLPLFTAGLTTFYMFRMWFLTFCGKPRDEHVFQHATESPWTMTVPLVLLAFFSVTVAWGMNPGDAEASELEHMIHHAQPNAVKGDFGQVKAIDGESEMKVSVNGKLRIIPGPVASSEANVRLEAHENHGAAGLTALGVVVIGLIFAYLIYIRHRIEAIDAVEQFPGLFNFLHHKWYFDELYSAIVVRPGLIVAGWARWFDTNVIDGTVHLVGKGTVIVSYLSGRNDRNIVDGLANLIGTVCQWIGGRLRQLQTGYLRTYVLFLVLAALGLWILLNAYYLGAAQR